MFKQTQYIQEKTISENYNSDKISMNRSSQKKEVYNNTSHIVEMVKMVDTPK